MHTHSLQVAILGVRHLVAIFALCGSAFVCGYRMTTRLRDADGFERGLVSIVLGLGSLATLIFVLGVARLLYPVVLFAVSATVVMGCTVPAISEVFNRIGSRSKANRPPSLPLLIAVALAMAIMPPVMLALYPPTAFDALLYHLPYAKIFAASHRLVFASQLRYPIFPQLNEMLFTAMLMMSDDLGAQLVQTLATLLTAAILIVWGRKSSTPFAGWIAAALWLGNPIVVYLSASAYVECGLALFVTAALWASERWRDTDETGWLVLSAAFAGFAAATKYTGLLAVALVLALTLRRPIREALRALAIATTIVLLVMFPWYARIIWITGNPVFPFLAKLFGDNPWVLKQPQLPANLAQLGAMPAWAESMVRGLAAPVIVAWNLIINRESLGDLPPVSPVYLVSLPALVLVPFWRQQTIPLAVAVVLLLSMLQLGLPPSAHYLVAIFPIWSLIVGYGCAIAIEAIIGRRRPQMRTPAIVSLCLLFFVPGRIYADYRRAKLGPVPTNEAEREGYLSEHLPVYPALQYLNRSRADNYTAYALFAENMIYYARGRFIGDWNGPASYPRVLKVLDNSCSLHQRLQQLGADYLIIPRANFPSVVPQDECFERCFAPVFSDLGALVFALVPRCDR